MFDWMRVWVGYKCKFHRDCPLYNTGSNICKENGGLYYGNKQPAGCFRDMEEKNVSKTKK